MAKRRALSTIVGSLIFVVIIVSAFGTLVLGLGHMTSFQEKSIEVSRRNFDQLSETFSVVTDFDSSCVLEANVNNIGSDSVEIVELYLLDVTGNTIKRFDVNNALIAPGVEKNVADLGLLTLDGSPAVQADITLALSTSYQVKVTSKLGTVEQTTFSVGDTCSSSGTTLIGELIGVPPEIASGDKVEVAFVVVNRGATDLSNVALDGLSPYLTVTPSGAADGAPSFLSPSSPSVTTLVSGGTVVFRWSVVLKGAIGQSITLSTSATSSDGPSTGSETATVTITRDYDREKVQDRLFDKVQIYAAFPSPMGESQTHGHFAIILVNPTNTDITVNQVSFQFINPEDKKTVDDANAVLPSSGWATGNSDGDDGNVAWWRTTATPTCSPQTHDTCIPKYSAKEFIVNLKSNDDPDDFVSPINSISVNAYTSFGQFSKTAGTLSLTKSRTGVANIYMSNSDSPPAGERPKYYEPAIYSNQQNKELYFTISNTGQAGDANEGYINVGSMAIVNIPAGFTYVSTSVPSGMVLDSATVLDDGSTQVKVRVTTAIAPPSREGENRKTFTITVHAPDIADTSQCDTTMYLFYAFVTGTTTDKDNNTQIFGSVAENVVQVLDPSLSSPSTGPCP